MTHRDRLSAVLQGNAVDIIPCFRECPMDVTCVKEVLPEPTGDEVVDRINEAKFYDNSAVDVGISPGVETLSQNSNEYIYRYQTGAVWRESYKPTYCREALQFPINAVSDIHEFRMPDPDDPVRLVSMKEHITEWKKQGYFVQGYTLGVWQSIYYLLTSFENVLMWMVLEPEAAKKLFELTSDYSMKAAKLMLEAGVDAVFVASDFGTSRGLLFSREIFRSYVFPWLEELASLCHSRGAILHLHSHGNIADVMDDIVESGVDMLNPIGPSDNNDLALYKDRWGDKITLMGGISTAIADMSFGEIDAHVKSVMSIGCRGGRFIPRTESGIPAMRSDKIMFYLDVLKKYRREYAVFYA